MASKIVATWFKWFWHLSRPAKLAATAAEIVLLWLAASHLPVTAVSQKAVIQGGSVALCFFLIAGILFGRTSR